jgi:hypothetical protein
MHAKVCDTASMDDMSVKHACKNTTVGASTPFADGGRFDNAFAEDTMLMASEAWRWRCWPLSS